MIPIQLSYLFRKIPGLRRWNYNYLNKFLSYNPNAEVVALITGNIKMLLSVNDWIQKNLFLHGYYEFAETAFWKVATKNKKVVFDIGANVGYFSLIASKNIDKTAGRIYAFEPVSRTFKRAVHNVELNSFKNIEVNQLALSDKKGELIINIGKDENWGMSSINKYDLLSDQSEKVNTDSVDNFIVANNINQLDIAKIDVEGSEFYVLSGMQKSIEKFRPVILIEVLEQHLAKAGSSVDAVFNYFLERNYKAYKILTGAKLETLSEAISYEGLLCFYPDEKIIQDNIQIVDSN